jgi:hypothetical protein
MVSFLPSLLTTQDSPQEEIESEGEKNLREGDICKKTEEEDKIHEETGEVEEEETEEEEENYEDDEGIEEEEENEDMDDDGAEEGGDEMKFKQNGYAGEIKETDHVDSGGRSQSPQNGDVSSADAQKVKVSCAGGSKTWCKLLNEFNALMKSLKSMNEVSQLVQLLQSMHSIIRCATEVTVLLENNCRCPPDETPFVTTFFDDYFGDMIRLLVQVLATLSYEDEEVGECVILMCLEMVGSILHMPESRYALKQDIEAAVTLLSLPWLKQVPPGSDMNHSLLSRVTQLTALSSKFSNYVTFINK